MHDSLFPATNSVGKIVATIVGAIVIAGGGIGYAVHEHNDAQAMATKNAQTTSQLSATQSEMQVLAAKVDALTQASQANSENNPAQPTISNGAGSGRRGSGSGSGVRAGRRLRDDPRFNKMQSQLDNQNAAIVQTQNELAGTQGDLVNTRTELTGSIAKTHDELVVLEKRGQRSYFEFDLSKTKEFKREGPINISLRKANDKRGFADLALIVDDRNLQQKHVNLYQPAMFYEPDSQMPVEVVINDISKDHIHGYVSAPKYRPSELAALENPATGESQSAGSGQNDNGVVGQAPTTGADQANPSSQPDTQTGPRQRLTLPDQDPNPSQQ
jgi:hypothetical protein